MAEKNSELTYNLGSSIFWILLVLISLSGLTYLGIWAYQNNSVKGVTLSFMFFSMIIAGIILSKFELFNMGTWGENASSFTLGFLIWGVVSYFTKNTYSVLSIAENSLFSTIAGELPELLELLMHGFVIPISEELFWLVGMPYAVFSIMNVIGKKVEIFANVWFQIFVAVIVGGVSFAVFHVANAAFRFMVAAFIFRTILIVLTWGDIKADFLKPLDLIVAFGVGAHIGNNLIRYGLSDAFLILSSNFFQIGWLVFGLLAIILLSGISYPIEKWIIGSKDDN